MFFGMKEEGRLRQHCFLAGRFRDAIHGVTVVTSGDSFRMKEARTRGGAPRTTL
jgi:hypothetical protein